MAEIGTPKKTYMRSFRDVCRLCGETGRLQQKLFSKSGEKKQINEKIFKATGLRLENDPNLPHAMCRKCERMIESIVAFQEKVTKSQHAFVASVTVKRVIDMSPSQEKLSMRKKFAADSQIRVPSSSRQLCFDNGAENTALPQPTSVTIQQLLPNTSERVFQRCVSIHNINVSPVISPSQQTARCAARSIQQPKSVKSKLADVYLAVPLTPSKTEAVERSTGTKEAVAVAHVIQTKVPTVLFGIKREIVKSLSSTCSGLCRRSGGSVLYDKDFKDMSEFEFANIWNEMVRSIPFFLDVLNAISGQTCDISDTPVGLQVKYAFIYSILMNKRWHELSLVQRINTVLMIRGGGSKQVNIVIYKVFLILHI